MEAASWFLLLTHSKMQEEKDKFKELLSRKESELEELENFQPIHIAKKKKQHVLKTLRVWVNYHLRRP